MEFPANYVTEHFLNSEKSDSKEANKDSPLSKRTVIIPLAFLISAIFNVLSS